MREFVKQIAVSMRHDETWVLDGHWADNGKLGVKVWTANGWSFAHVRWAAERRSYGGWGDEVKINLTMLEKIHIWRAFRALRKRKRAGVYDKVLESIIERRLSSNQ